MADTDGLKPSAHSEATALKAVQSLGAVIGPTALVTALLFYFGWARAQSQAQYLGLDVTLFGFSTQDYILQATYSVLFPLGALLIGGLVLLWAHGVVCSLVDGDPGRVVWPWAERVLALGGAALFGVGLLLNSDRYPTEAVLIMTPLSLTLGVGLIAYGVLVRRRRTGALRDVAGQGSGRTVPLLSVILVAMLLAVGIVWEVANYAEIKGRELGEFLVSQLAYQPGVVVFSPKRLHLQGGGVVEIALREPDSAYAFRYTGMKLLFRSDERYFLVPESWSVANGRSIVLRDSEDLRLEFIRPPD